MAKAEKSKRMEKAKRGTLMLLAIFLMGSAAVRIALEAAPAIALEVSEMQSSDDGSNVPTAGGGRSTVPDSAEMQAMLAAFKKRETLLNEREAELEDRMRALEIADQAINKKLTDLQQAEEKLLATLALADGAAEQDVTKLTSVYEQMKPKEAAALFEEMDPTFAAGFLARMRPEAAAGVMAGLSPEAAYTISVVLAGRNGEVPKE
ncbi:MULTISPECIES: MotE family protein [Tritonibacter]|uniref:Flagellar motility protein MotE (MotC chaperone) n=1 Tax=Tritonibacter scottomollicae TaxID=483013 RepID=A0A2T1ALH9_TRISK|nr:hypothetical protein [Tritonibacter scottomollicae]PRZ49461.1 flagellar motility protein MotE (MotC chaperone) [Tritonibacter scottomollicae]